MSESPFGLCYGAEVALPTELKYPYIKIEIFADPSHAQLLAFEADLREWMWVKAYIHLTNYQQMLPRHYN